jgi:glyoxylase-like metal-dependent hydrolase (beta-lactamase superfamily II)
MGQASMLSFQWFQAGFCKHYACVTLQGGKFKKLRYPALCFFIQHPRFGNILYDTGYSQRFCALTSSFPECIYQWITPVTQTQDLKVQLQAKNINPETINFIIISHFHSDHLGGLMDFPNAKFICHSEAWKSIKHLGRYRSLFRAFIPRLLPKDFEIRLQLLNHRQTIKLTSDMIPFDTGYDILGDGSLIVIDLPGHAKGHIGVLFQDNMGKIIFLVGDSCWHKQSFQSLRMPSLLTYLFHDNKKTYVDTIQKLHQLYLKNPKIKIIPSHCQLSLNDLA